MQLQLRPDDDKDALQGWVQRVDCEVDIVDVEDRKCDDPKT